MAGGVGGQLTTTKKKERRTFLFWKEQRRRVAGALRVHSTGRPEISNPRFTPISLKTLLDSFIYFCFRSSSSFLHDRFIGGCFFLAVVQIESVQPRILLELLVQVSCRSALFLPNFHFVELNTFLLKLAVSRITARSSPRGPHRISNLRFRPISLRTPLDLNWDRYSIEFCVFEPYIFTFCRPFQGFRWISFVGCIGFLICASC